MSEITPEIVQSHQLTPDEYQRIVAILGRELIERPLIGGVAAFAMRDGHAQLGV